MVAKRGKPESHLLEEIRRLRSKLSELKPAKWAGSTCTDGLNRSRVQLDSIFEAAPFAMVLLDLEGNIKKCNRQFTDLHRTKGSVDEQKGKNISEFFVPEDRPKFFASMNRIIKGKSRLLKPNEYRMLRGDGTVFAAEGFSILLPDVSGRPDVILGVAYDISERKQAEEALRESQRTLTTLIGNLPGVVYRCLCVPEWTMKFISEGCYELTGYEPSELIDNRIISYGGVIFPEDREYVWQKVNECVEQRRHFELQYRIRTRSGEVRWVWERGIGVFDNNGRVLALEGFITDITEEKRGEDELRREQDRARKYLDVAGVVFVAIDKNENVVMINRKGCEILGYDESEIVGRNWFDVFLPESARQAVRETFSRLMSGEIEPIENFENPVLTKGGEERIIAWHNIVLKDEEGKITHTLSSGEDITERKAAEKKLIDYHDKLKSMVTSSFLAEERERQRIAQGLHDEIGQKLAVVKFTVRSLLEHKLPDELKKSLERASSDIEVMIEQVRSLTFELSNPVLNELGIEAAVERHLVKEVRGKHGIEFELALCGELSRLDEDLAMCLFRTMRELLNNVVKHARASCVEVTFERRGDNVVITLRDNGVGFDPAKLSAKGGYGLFSIREQLENYGGGLEIESGPGHGAKFIITVPFFIRRTNSQA